MKIIFKNLDSIIATLSFILAYCLFYNSVDSKDFLGIVLAIATIYFGVLKHRIENDKMFKELFESFNKKYDGTLNDLFNDLRRDPKMELDAKHKNLIIDYFNLCAEEFLWFEKRRIPKKVWQAWKSGIKENLQLPKIRELYDQEIKTEDSRKSFYGLVEELNRK